MPARTGSGWWGGWDSIEGTRAGGREGRGEKGGS